MGIGFTQPPQTPQQLAEKREKKRLTQQRVRYGVCRASHVQTPDNAHLYEGVPYCKACVEAGTKIPWTPRWVYFITDDAGHVKIGYTVDIGSRLRALQTSTPFALRVLGAMKGGHDMEHALHERFAEHRVRGEWFRLVPEIVDYIANIPPPPPPPLPPPLPPLPEPEPEKPKKIPDYVRIQQELTRAHQSALASAP